MHAPDLSDRLIELSSHSHCGSSRYSEALQLRRESQRNMVDSSPGPRASAKSYDGNSEQGSRHRDHTEPLPHQYDRESLV